MKSFFRRVVEYWNLLGRTIYEGERLEQNLRVNTWIGAVVAVIGAVMTIMNIVQDKGIVSLVTGLISLSGVLIIISVRVWKNRTFAMVCALFISTVLFTWMALNGVNDGFAILWTMIVPLAFCYFQSVKYGIMFSAYYELLFVFMFYTPMRAKMALYYSETFMNRYPILFFCALLINSTAMIQYHTTMLMQMEFEKMHEEAVKAAIAAGNAKSRFLAQVSHEIRTPINAMLGMNEMIIRECSDKNIREYSGNIQSAGNTLLGLVNSVLDFSKIEDGKMELTPAEYEVAPLINNLVNSIIYRAHEKGLAFYVNVDRSIPAGLYGDDMRISQIIMNLLTNAVKYTKKGEVTLTITCQSKNEKEAELFVSVRDTGIGIKSDDIERLFDDFKRLDLQVNRSIEGTGLGMPIVTNLLDLMGSKLIVESEYGSGSTFSFVIRQGIVDPEPMGDYEERLADMDMKRTVHRNFRAPGARVLVVDDNAMNLKVASGFLKICGITPDTADSGDHAIECMRKDRYDVVFLDHMMPKKDGIQTLHELRDESLIPEGTTMVALTANAVVGARESYLASGFDDYLSKPLNMDALVELLTKYLPEDMYSFEEEPDASTESSSPTDTQVSSVADTGSGSSTEEDEYGLAELGFDAKKLAAIGMDLREGLDNCAEDPELFGEMLEEYLKEYEVKRKKLDDLCTNENWNDYQIQIHALKGTSRTIGLTGLSEKAKELEFAAKDSNYDLIKSRHSACMEEFKKAVEGIGAAH